MTKTHIKKGKKYKFCSDMIKEALTENFKHVPGKSLACTHCKSRKTVRKLTKNKKTLYACYVCGVRWY